MGRLVPQKNYEMLLRAFAAGARPDDELTIFGDGESRASLERLAKQLGLGPRLSFEGHVAHSASCMIGQDAMLMTSHFEGIPAALIEGMTCGMPIVATDCGVGVRSLVDGYPSGTLVARGDTTAFAATIATLAIAEAPDLGFDPTVYTIEAGAVAYVDVFHQVVRTPSPADPPSYQVEIGDVLLEPGMIAQRSLLPSEQRGSA